MIAYPAAEQAVIWTRPEPGPDWHPEVRHMFAYWYALRPPSGLPGRQHFDPIDVVPLLPGVWLLDIQKQPFRLRYRLVGTRVTESIGRDVTGMWMDEAHPDALQVPGYFDRYRAVVETAQPSWRKGRARLYIHQDYSTLENIFLPLARDGRAVDMILAFTGVHL